MRKIRVALVHDYLREYGGAERVLEALHEIYPEAPVYTAFVDKRALGIHWQRFSNWEIIESKASVIPFIRKLYSPLRVFAAYFFEGFDLSSYDLVISSTNMYMAKAVLTRPSTLHISYIHTPPRSLYGYSTMTNWKKNLFIRMLGELINFRLRQVDFLTSKRPDILIANSEEVRGRIQKYYRRDAIVIYPPVQGPIESKAVTGNGEYFLYVNRLAFAKHPEIAVKACSELHYPLKVVGTGQMRAELQSIAGDSVQFLGAVSDSDLSKVYANAKALLYPVEDEDFGIVPVEAQMHGIPVIAQNSGGPKETVIDGKTGVLFSQLSVAGLLDAIKRFESLSFSSEVIRTHAQKFSKKMFTEKVLAVVDRNLPQE